MPPAVITLAEILHTTHFPKDASITVVKGKKNSVREPLLPSPRFPVCGVLDPKRLVLLLRCFGMC